MQITYDPRYNIAYIRFRTEKAQVETIQLSDSVNVDIAPDGTLFGIELLNANEQIGQLPHVALELVNEASGKTAMIELP